MSHLVSHAPRLHHLSQKAETHWKPVQLAEDREQRETRSSNEEFFFILLCIYIYIYIYIYYNSCRALLVSRKGALEMIIILHMGMPMRMSLKRNGQAQTTYNKLHVLLIEGNFACHFQSSTQFYKSFLALYTSFYFSFRLIRKHS